MSNLKLKREPDATPWTDLRAVRRHRTKHRQWLAQGAIEAGQLVVLAGPEKRGKSTALADLLVASAIGGSWLDRFRCAQGPVVYIDAENNPGRFVHMLESVCRAQGHDVEKVLGNTRYHWSSFTLAEDDADLDAIVQDLDARPAALVILDPLRQHVAGSEVDTANIRDALRQAQRLQTRANTTLVIAHHLNANGQMAGNRAIRTMADLLIIGTDAKSPKYSSHGRTLRDRDPIATPFVIDLDDRHDDDTDDTRRELHLRARFDGEAKPKGIDMSAHAHRVLGVLASADAPLTKTKIRELAKLSGQAAASALAELECDGKATKSGRLWTIGGAG